MGSGPKPTDIDDAATPPTAPNRPGELKLQKSMTSSFIYNYLEYGVLVGWCTTRGALGSRDRPLSFLYCFAHSGRPDSAKAFPPLLTRWAMYLVPPGPCTVYLGTP